MAHPTPLDPFNEHLIGDDQPFNTILYRDVPEGYRIEDIQLDESKYPKIAELREALDSQANIYFELYEIAAITIKGFFDAISFALVSNADTFEAFLSATEELAKPNRQNTVIFKPETTITNEQLVDGETRDIDVPFDDAGNDQATKKTQTNFGKNQTSNSGQNQTDYINNDFETLRQFLDANPKIMDEYIKIFKDNFTLRQAFKW